MAAVAGGCMMPAVMRMLAEPAAALRAVAVADAASDPAAPQGRDGRSGSA